jgi:hypothetical protein
MSADKGDCRTTLDSYSAAWHAPLPQAHAPFAIGPKPHMAAVSKDAPSPPTTALNSESVFTVSRSHSGQVNGSFAWLIGRRASYVWLQDRQ